MRAGANRSEVMAEDTETLTISPEKVCFVIIKAREFDAKDEVTEPDPGSNPSDDRNAAILEDHDDDPVVEELWSRKASATPANTPLASSAIRALASSFVNSLSEDEQIDLVAASGKKIYRLDARKMS